MPGIVTPATIGWNIVRSSCRPRKYHGAFDGFGVWLTLASSWNGALTKIEKNSVKEVHASAAANSTTSRCGHVCTLSCGVALTSWIEPDLTTVSRRWVCPPGPVSVGAGPATAGTAPPAAGAVATAVAVPPPAGAASPPPADFSRAALLRSSRCAGILLAPRVAPAPPARPLARRAGRQRRRRPCGLWPRPWLWPLRPACADVQELSVIEVEPRLVNSCPRADPRCRRLCGLARNGSP